MRLTGIILLAAVLQVSARGTAQTVTYSATAVPLATVFSVIERQTHYVFFYRKEDLREAMPVTVQLRNTPLQDALGAIFAGQPVSFDIQGNTVVIIPKPPSAVPADTAGKKPATLKVEGLVNNENGEPLSGASVTVLATKKSTITNQKGSFSVQAADNDFLLISYIGYESQKVRVKQGQRVFINLKTATDELDKVVVQSYGNTSQRLTTGDVAVVTAEEIEKQPVMNPLLALQGRVAGLDIQQTSGYASAPVLATLRGLSSVDGSVITEPLYIIDGVPLTVVHVGGAQAFNSGSSGFLQSPAGNGPADGQSPLFSVNPSDIESISVLKDADATSIYGSRGANGVILITTKKGHPGKTHLNLHVDEGVNKVTRFWKLMNTTQYLAMRREAFRNDGITPTINNAPDLLVFDTTRDTDWQRALYGRSGREVNAQLSLTGGDVRTNFRLGMGYKHSTEITTANGADQQASVTLGLTHRSPDDRLTITLSTLFTYSQSDMVSLTGAINYVPDAPAIYDSTGNLNWSGWDRGVNTGANPFAVALQPYTAKTNFINSGATISYALLRGLMLTAILGYSSAQANTLQLYPIAAQDPATQPVGGSVFAYNTHKNWNIEPQLTYQTVIGPVKVQVITGASENQTSTDGLAITGTGFSSDNLLRTVSNAPQQYSGDNYAETRYASVYGRAGFNLNDEYLLNLSARRDGSSNFGPGHQFGNFASVGAAWIFTEKDWMKRYFPFISFGKLHGSYGTSGSDGGGTPYGYITRWSGANLNSFDGIQPLVPLQHANPNYHWEQDRKLEVGMNLGFFKDWVTIHTAYYSRKTNDQLLSYPTALFTGFYSVVSNLPALVENTGWEFTIGGKGVQVKTKYFHWAWSPNINFSINRNKFVAFTGLGSAAYRSQGYIGNALYGNYLLHSTGVDPQTGRYSYQDRDHDGTIYPYYVAPNGGDVYFKKLSPAFMTGFGFNFDQNGFNLALNFSVKKQIGLNGIYRTARAGNYSNYQGNVPLEMLGRWQKPGDNVSIGKYSTTNKEDPNSYLGYSDLAYTDASFIRLQNISLSYNLPDAFVKKAGMQSFSLFIHASNIFVITAYKGIDPETQNFGGMPPTRTIVGGCSINF